MEKFQLAHTGKELDDALTIFMDGFKTEGLNVTENGSYVPSEGVHGFSEVTVAVADAKAIVERTITEFKDNTAEKVGEYAFYGCEALTEVSLPNVKTIGTAAFSGCSAISVLELPNAVSWEKGSLDGVGNGSLKLCLPKTTSISAYNFNNYGARILDLPAIKSLPNYFMHYTGKTTGNILLRNTSVVCSLGGTNVFHNCYVYVPSALYDSYCVATNWSSKTDIIRILEDYTVDGTTTGELDETKI